MAETKKVWVKIVDEEGKNVNVIGKESLEGLMAKDTFYVLPGGGIFKRDQVFFPGDQENTEVKIFAKLKVLIGTDYDFREAGLISDVPKNAEIVYINQEEPFRHIKRTADVTKHLKERESDLEEESKGKSSSMKWMSWGLVGLAMLAVVFLIGWLTQVGKLNEARVLISTNVITIVPATDFSEIKSSKKELVAASKAKENAEKLLIVAYSAEKDGALSYFVYQNGVALEMGKHFAIEQSSHKKTVSIFPEGKPEIEFQIPNVKKGKAKYIAVP